MQQRWPPEARLASTRVHTPGWHMQGCIHSSPHTQNPFPLSTHCTPSPTSNPLPFHSRWFHLPKTGQGNHLWHPSPWAPAPWAFSSCCSGPGCAKGHIFMKSPPMCVQWLCANLFLGEVFPRVAFPLCSKKQEKWRKHPGLGYEKLWELWKQTGFLHFPWGRWFQHEVSGSNGNMGSYHMDHPWWWCPSVLMSWAHCCPLLALGQAGWPLPASSASTSYSPPLQKHTTRARGSCDMGLHCWSSLKQE